MSEGFAKVRLAATPRDLARKSDTDLALWQSQYQPGSREYLSADREWNRRLTASQVSAMKFAAVVGVCGTLLGAVVGAYIQSQGSTSPTKGETTAEKGRGAPQVNPAPAISVKPSTQKQPQQQVPNKSGQHVEGKP